ncbi:Bardet-Biedl syndrome 10 protein homolog [Ylistrum balloti]|uniref:Bardet-Biedl syndrome 10 protein homolog n=1 Tax=Ylistrum balloti TaxID=509963 RepID=UPI0029059F1D|nr:Bardet-Biedl syndrome 10 protein homolog [Ylistrum balloti]
MDSTGNLNVMDFSTVRLICSTLENVVKKSFGPLGLQTLLCTATGHLVVTNDGLTTIEVLHLSHPVAKLIIQSLSKSIHYTGDGSKTFILWLAKCVRDIEEEILLSTGKKTPTNGYQCSLESKYRIQMSRDLNKILPELLKGIVKYVWDHSAACKCRQGKEEEILYTKRIIHTVIRPHFPQNISNIFTELLYNMVQFDHDSDAKIYLRYIIDHFETLCIKVGNQPYTSSTMLESFVIQRDFTVYCPQTLNGNVKFVLLRCLVGQLNTENKNEKIKLTNSQVIGHYLQNQKKLIKDFISVCQQYGIKLVLSTEKVPDFIQEIFQSGAISLVHYVSDEEADFLQTSLKIHPITNLFDTVEEKNIGLSKQCKALVIAGQRCVHLNLRGLPPMLLVCGLSDGLCKQVMLASIKALKTLLHYHQTEELIPIINQGETTDQNTSLMKDVCAVGMSEREHCETLGTPGAVVKECYSLCVCHNTVVGNSFEFMAAKYCEERAKELRVRDIGQSILFQIFSKALLAVPQVLHENSCGSQSDRVSFIKKQQLVFSELDKLGKCDLRDILSSAGYGHNVGECVEPLNVKVHLLSTLTELLQQLLRIDSIVGVQSVHV